MTSSPDAIPAADQRQLLCTHAIYGLQGLSVAAGVVTTLLGHRSLLFALPALGGVALIVAQRVQLQHEDRLATHWRWQWHTFWWALIAIAAVTLGFGTALSFLTSIPLLQIGYLAVAAWAAWRLARGWLALRAGRPLHGEAA